MLRLICACINYKIGLLITAHSFISTYNTSFFSFSERCLLQFSLWTDSVASHSLILAAMFIVSFILMVLGSDLGLSHGAKDFDFYGVMSFPVGTLVATSLPARLLLPWPILVLDRRKLERAQHRQACAKLQRKEFVGINKSPVCFVAAKRNIWKFVFNIKKVSLFVFCTICLFILCKGL